MVVREPQPELASTVCTKASVGMIVCRKWSTTASGAASTASTARRESENQSEPWKTGSGGRGGKPTYVPDGSVRTWTSGSSRANAKGSGP